MIVVECKMYRHGNPNDTYELFTMTISNEGGTETHADYHAKMYRRPHKGKTTNIREQQPLRTGVVRNHARKRTHVSSLVKKAIEACYPNSS